MDPLDESVKRQEKGHIVLKYVRNDFGDFIFGPIYIDHKKLVIKNPISAGFIDFTTMEIFGYSVGLGLKPRNDDIEVLKTFLRINK